MMHESGFQTERLVIRPLEAADAYAMTALLLDPDVSRWLAIFPQPFTHEASVSWCERAARDLASGDGGLMGVFLRDTGVLIGNIALHLNEDRQSAEAGYWLGKNFHGHGYAAEALGAILDFAFSLPHLSHIHATAASDNMSSDKLLVKKGFHRTHLGERVTADGAVRTSQHYRLERKTWREQQKASCS